MQTSTLKGYEPGFGKCPTINCGNFGQAARYMVSPTANMGKPPLPAFVMQLEEARAEWRRRHSPL